MFQQILLNGLVTGSLYALGAIGFALVYNTTRIFHIAYAALFAAAGYICYWMNAAGGLNFFAAVLVALALSALFSMGVDKFVYLPLEKRKSSGNVKMISSIGLMIVMVNLIGMLFGNEVKIFSSLISSSWQWNGLVFTRNQFMQLAVSSSVIAVFLVSLKFSRLGILTRAMRDDTELLSVFGIDAAPTRRMLFLISGAMVALVSCLIAYDVGLDPYVGMPFLLNVIVALIIGGLGNFYAPVLGGFLLAFVQSVSVCFFEAKWESAITFVVLLTFLLFRPQGIMGETQRMV